MASPSPPTPRTNSDIEKKVGRCNLVIVVLSAIFVGAIALGVALTPHPESAGSKTVPETVHPRYQATVDNKALDDELSKFVEVPFTSPLVASLPLSEKKALQHLALAAEAMNSLYVSQLWNGAPAVAKALASDAREAGFDVQPSLGSPVSGSPVLKAFWFHGGPWNDTEQRFIETEAGSPIVPERRPPGGSLYPEDATKAELLRWMEGLSGQQLEEATSFFTVIRRAEMGSEFRTEPYSQAFQAELRGIQRQLRLAAAATEDGGLKEFLYARADALASNDYGPSDALWLSLNSTIDPTIGPYESYADEIFAYKAFFEAYICIVRPDETAKLQVLKSVLQYLEDHLPIAPSLRNPSLGAGASIKVVDQVYAGGEAREGVQTIAFNLPNNATTTARYGTKRVMMRNANLAKFERILVPIAEELIDEDQMQFITFDAFFLHVLAHELMHGLGPHTVTSNCSGDAGCLDGRDVREILAEHYSAIEEGKADIAGLWALQFLHDNPPSGETLPIFSDKVTLSHLYVTFLASAFRSLRFGVREAHAQGIAIQMQKLLESGAVVRNETTGRYRVRLESLNLMKDTVRDITGLLMMLQANGDKAGAAALKSSAVTEIEALTSSALERLSHIPVDVRPVFASNLVSATG